MALDLGVVQMPVALLVVGVLAKYAGVADKIGKNFDYIMAGALVYLLADIIEQLGIAGAATGISMYTGDALASIVVNLGALLELVAVVCVIVGAALGALKLLGK